MNFTIHKSFMQPTKSTQTIIKWAISIIASFLFAWIVSYFFTDSLSPKIFDKEVDRYVLEPDTRVRKRSEGWATTMVGPHGVTGLYSDESKKKSIIAIWGDSYVEGFQVDDSEKAGSVITHECSGRNESVGLNIGMSGQSVADYYFAIPEYEKVFPTISMHYIVLGSMSDVLPDNNDAQLSKFVSLPEFALKEREFKQTAYWLKSMLYSYKLDFIWFLVKEVFKQDLRFMPSFGKFDAQKQNDGSEIRDYNEAWDFLLSKMVNITDKPLSFIYCPAVPSLTNSTVDFIDSEQNLALQFEKKCKSYDFDFINLNDDFIQYYKKTGFFPRGFANSRLSSGHLNASGHRLLAKAILRHARAEEE